MAYTGSQHQNSLLLSALRMLKEKRIPDRRVVEAIAVWKTHLGSSSDPTSSNHLTRVPLSESAYSSYRRGQRRPDFDRAKLIYEFLESGFDPDFRTDTINPYNIDISSEDGALAQKVLGFVGTVESASRYRDVSSLLGTYSMYRRNWIRDSGNSIIRSKFSVEHAGGVYLMNETQNFVFRGKAIDEIDHGLVFPYATNFFALSNSSTSLKFYTIHDMYPPLRRDVRVEELMGTVTGMTSQGPHPSFPFICKRSSSTVETGVLRMADAESNPEFEGVVQYLFG